MENVHKILDCEVKKVGEREYEFIASTIGMDRDGEVIDPAGWDLKNFKKNPVIMYGHDYSGLPIGRAPKVGISNGALKNTVEFPPEGTYEFADIVERLVKEGFLNTESVGFIPKEWKDGNGGKGPRRTYTKQELLEISIVPVPSNPDALREAVEKGVITEEQLEVVTKSEEAEDVVEEKQPKTMSQSEIKDELDYILIICQEHTLNEGNQALAKQLIGELRRLSGGDTPVEIEESEEEVESLNNEEFREFLYEEIKRQIGGKLNA